MIVRKPFISLIAFSLFAAAPVEAGSKELVKEGASKMVVKAEAPIPKEIGNEAEAHRIAKEAAVAWGQTQLLTYVLKKKARSGKILAVAEIPSLELQAEIREYVKKAEVTDVEYTSKICKLALELSKTQLKTILRKN